MSVGRSVFVTMARSPEQRRGAAMLIESIRSFGGPMSRNPVWLFETDPADARCSDLAADGVDVVPLRPPDGVRGYYYADKVHAAARAEEMAGASVDTLVLLSPECLVTRPPVLFELPGGLDAAVRPVHIRNVGVGVDDPVGGFWRGVYGATGVDDLEGSVESYVDVQTIRPYYNSAAYSVRPAAGLLSEWRDRFAGLVLDRDYQSAFCADERHRIFLHQAVLSAILATRIEKDRVRVLPPDYGYPYNLHGSVPEERRARLLNDLTCVIYDERSLDPAEMADIEVREPLKSWLSGHAADAERWRS